MDESDIVTTIDAVEEVEEKLEGIEDCDTADGEDMTELFPVSPLKLEEKSSTISVSTSTVATTASAADGEHTTTDSTLELDEEVQEDRSGSSVPPLLNSSVNTSTGDVQQTNIVSLLEEESSGSNSVDVSQETNNDSDSVLTVVLEGESSGSDGVPTSPKSEPNTSDVTQQANKDAPLVLDEDPEEKPSTSGSVSIWEKSTVASSMSVALKQADVDPNNETEQEEEVKSAAEGNENEALILNDKSLLAQSLIVKLMNLLLTKRLAEVTNIKNKSNSRKRPSSAISEAGASETCGSSTSEPSTHGPPPQTMTTNCTLMDYYINKRKQEGTNYNYSQLLIDNSGLEMELNYYTERMKSFIMLPAKHPNKPEETEESNPVKRVREEDETNGAQNSKMTDLC